MLALESVNAMDFPIAIYSFPMFYSFPPLKEPCVHVPLRQVFFLPAQQSIWDRLVWEWEEKLLFFFFFVKKKKTKKNWH